MRAKSIRFKLKAIVMAVSGLAVLMACGSYLALNSYFLHGAVEHDLAALAETMGRECEDALAVGDAKAAGAILEGFRNRRNLSAATLVAADGRPLTGFGTSSRKDLEVRRDLHRGPVRIGSVLVRSDLSEAREQQTRNTLFTGLAVLLALLTASLLAVRLERVITRPILGLAEIVKEVAQRKDFSLRASRSADDETGTLIDGFNDMLVQIQARDATLGRMREDLEERVARRTAELTQANQALEAEIGRRRRVNEELQKENAERRRAESSLRRADLHQRQLVETVQAIVWRADAQTLQPTYVSPEAEKLLGRPVQDWLASPGAWIDHVHPADREAVAEACRRAARQGRHLEITYRMAAADGRTVWLRDMIKVVTENGVIRELIGVKVDVTRQKETEAAMRESEERYRHLFESSPDAILIESDGAVLLMNPAAEQLMGVGSPEELAGHPILESVLPARRSAGAVAPAGSFEDSWRRSDGSSVDVEVSVIPFSRRGRPGAQVVARDITRRKEADRLKNEFVSTVSHELRTPLTAIRGALSLLAAEKAGALPPKAKFLLDIANGDCQRLVRIINDLLDIQKIEAGRMEFQMQPIDLAALVRKSVEANRSYAEPLGVRFSFPEPDEPAPATGDPDRIQQVLANLLSNAAKFSPRNSTVDVSMERSGEAVRISVRDRGPGIPQEFRARIFQKFMQADASDCRRPGGTGLGLHICKTMVERQGGSIGFDDAPGGGSIFWFELPSRAASLLPV